MLKILLLLFVAALCQAQDFASKAGEYIDGVVKQGKFMGSVLIAKDGKILLSKGYGMANIEHDVPNGPNTKFRLGSITKQFTAALILQLQEKEKLSVGDPICKYFAKCPAAWAKITIHHLLTHTSGIPNYTSLPNFMKTAMIPVTVDELIALFKDRPLDFDPGSTFRYSNSGYEVLGYIIEKASGESYEACLRKSIFDRLEMRDSGYDHDRTILKHRASGYLHEKGELRNAQYLDMSIPYAAGSLYSTVEDLYRWDRVLYTEKVLSKKSLEQMFTPFKDGYAYGFAIGQRSNRKNMSHGGGIFGFSTFISRYPDDNACAIVLSNLEDAASEEISHDLEAMLFSAR